MEEIALPSLDESDSLVRNLVAALTSHPAFAAWLIPDQLVRTFVLVVDNVADGNNPAARLPPLRFTHRPHSLRPRWKPPVRPRKMTTVSW